MLIYKIMSRSEWEAFNKDGVFKGSEVDLKDGFIHFSTKEQTAETANKHFSSQNGLVLVAVDDKVLGEALTYEPSRGGQLFPHLYAPLALDAIDSSTSFNPADNGVFQFPEDFS